MKLPYQARYSDVDFGGCPVRLSAALAAAAQLSKPYEITDRTSRLVAISPGRTRDSVMQRDRGRSNTRCLWY